MGIGVGEGGDRGRRGGSRGRRGWGSGSMRKREGSRREVEQGLYQGKESVQVDVCRCVGPEAIRITLKVGTINVRICK